MEIGIAGNFGVGKTSLMRRFMENTFDEKSPTVNVDFMIKDYDYNGKTVKIKILDTAGTMFCVACGLFFLLV